MGILFLFFFLFSHLPLFHSSYQLLVFFFTRVLLVSFLFPFFVSPLFLPPVKRIRLSKLFPSWESTSDFNLLAVQPCVGSWVLHNGVSLDPSVLSPKPHNTIYLLTSLGWLLKDLLELMFPCWRSQTRTTFPLEAYMLMSLLGRLLHLRLLLFLWHSLFSTGLLTRFVLNVLISISEKSSRVNILTVNVLPNVFSVTILHAFLSHSLWLIPFCSVFPLALSLLLVELIRCLPHTHLVMPLTVEPSKPRLCNDNHFLNLWMVDKPFTLDRLSDLPLYVGPDSFQTVCDNKSG